MWVLSLLAHKRQTGWVVRMVMLLADYPTRSMHWRVRKFRGQARCHSSKEETAQENLACFVMTEESQWVRNQGR